MSAYSFFCRSSLCLTAVAIALIFSGERCYAGPKGTLQDANAVPPISEKRLVELAKRDHIALFELAMKRYEKSIKDYTGTFCKQERRRGRLGKEQIISFKFKEKPYSVYMEWKKNSGNADKVLYAKSQNKDKMIVHPTGIFSWIKSVKRNPRGRDARRSSFYTCDQFGFYDSMKRVLKDYELAKKSGDLEIKYTGPTKVHDRKCIAFEAMLPKKEGYSTARLVTKLDIEYLLPVAMERYDWDGNLLFRVSFRDLKFNTGLKDEDFKPAVYGL